MTDNNKTSLNAATSRLVEVGSNRSDSIPHHKHTTQGQVGQRKIADLLSHGRENGLHLRDLVKLTEWTEREVRAQIHRERRQHIPILSNNRDGYYLPGDDQERVACVRSMRHRAAEILAAARAIDTGGDADWTMH